MERLAQDDLTQLELIYQKGEKNELGKTIRDIALVWQQLLEWRSIEEIDSIIPFVNTTKKEEPLGYRIWMFSRHKGESYYRGNFFDCIVSEAKKKQIRTKAKLSGEAIKFFEKNFPQKDVEHPHTTAYTNAVKRNKAHNRKEVISNAN